MFLNNFKLYTCQVIRIIKSKRDIWGNFAGALFFSFLLGLMTLGSSFFNPYLLLIAFPSVGLMTTFGITMFLFRAQGQNILKLQTTPSGLRGVLIGTMSIIFTVFLLEHIILEVVIIAVDWSAFRVYAPELPVQSEYVPDFVSLVLLLVCSASSYFYYIGLSIWYISNLNVKGISTKPEGFAAVSGHYGRGALGYFIMSFISFFMSYTIRDVIEGRKSFDIITIANNPVFWFSILIIFNIVSSWLIWKRAWRVIEERPFIEVFNLNDWRPIID